MEPDNCGESVPGTGGGRRGIRTNKKLSDTTGGPTPSVAAVRSEHLIKACVGKRVCGSEAGEAHEEANER